jgi:hypothetical protein
MWSTTRKNAFDWAVASCTQLTAHPSLSQSPTASPFRFHTDLHSCVFRCLHDVNDILDGLRLGDERPCTNGDVETLTQETGHDGNADAGRFLRGEAQLAGGRRLRVGPR